MRSAVIGVGYLGRFHAQKYKKLSEKVELIGVSDSNREQCSAVAQELQVQPFYNHELLIGQVDMVTIATSTPSHYQLAKFFLEKGIHVNVEKPMTLQTHESGELVALAKKNNLILCVGHSERFNPAFIELKKHLKSPIFIDCQRHAPFKLRGSEVSVVFDLMIHDIDLMLHLCSGSAQLLWAKGGKLVTEQFDWAMAGIKFDSGAIVTLGASRVVKNMNRTCEIWQKNNKIKADLQNGQLEITQIQSGEPYWSTVETGKGDNLLVETDQFIESVMSKKNKSISGEEGHQALLWAEKIEQLIKHE